MTRPEDELKIEGLRRNHPIVNVFLDQQLEDAAWEAFLDLYSSELLTEVERNLTPKGLKLILIANTLHAPEIFLNPEKSTVEQYNRIRNLFSMGYALGENPQLLVVPSIMSLHYRKYLDSRFLGSPGFNKQDPIYLSVRYVTQVMNYGAGLKLYGRLINPQIMDFIKGLNNLDQL